MKLKHKDVADYGLNNLAKKLENGSCFNSEEVRYISLKTKAPRRILVEAVAGSIDAVDRLRKELLPDSFVGVWQHERFKVVVTFYDDERQLFEFSSSAPTEAAARLAALLRALEGKEDG